MASRLKRRLGLVMGLAICWGLAPNLAQAFSPPAGVLIDSKGVLRTITYPDQTLELTRQRISESKAAQNPKVAQKSTLRKVSLNRLEKALEGQLANDRRPTDEMLHLAGLTRLTHVFVYPDSGDVVIAGPAEGWFKDLSGRSVGVQTGKAILQLEDLVTALRAYPPGAKGTRFIGCSIDATKEGLARMQQFLGSLPRTADASMATDEYAQYIVDGLRTSLGLQKVRIDGVPPESHFAQVLVEADYRMKLIGIGLEVPPVKITSYVDRANPAQVASNAMQRWWFVPDYKCVKVSEDKLAMEMIGQGLQLMNEDEVVLAGGQRKGTGQSQNRASQAFVQNFTQKYPELASKVPVYGQLRNLVDMAIAATFMQEQDYYGKAGWKMTTLADETKFPVQTCTTPVEVETAVAKKWKGLQLMTPVGGGVSLRPQTALTSENLLADEDGKVEKARQGVSVTNLAEGQWWWD